MQETITYAIVMVTTSFRLTSITDKRIKVGIKETNSSVKKCIKHYRCRWWQSHSSLTTETKKINWTQFCYWSEYSFCSENFFRGENQPLIPKMECHHHRSRNRILIFHLLLPLFSLLLLQVRAVEADQFAWLNVSLIALAVVVSCVTERWRTVTNVYFCYCDKCLRPALNSWIPNYLLGTLYLSNS